MRIKQFMNRIIEGLCLWERGLTGKVGQLILPIMYSIYVVSMLSFNQEIRAFVVLQMKTQLGPPSTRFPFNGVSIEGETTYDSQFVLHQLTNHLIVRARNIRARGICFCILPCNIQRIYHLTTASMLDNVFGSNRRTATKKHFLLLGRGGRGCSMRFSF